MKNLFLCIDCQNDFCHPDGSLFVPGADSDMDKLTLYLNKNRSKIDGFVLVMDTHSVNDIAHPSYWVDPEGKHPKPFTTIKKKEAKGRKYTVSIPGAEEKVVLEKQKMAVEYLLDLESVGKTHTIWPQHCVQGTWGHAIYKPLMDSILYWSQELGRDATIYPKGMFPHSEHFGAFEAEVPNPHFPETTIVASQKLLDTVVDNFENVYLCGEAKSHCVAATLAQIIKLVKGTGFVDLIKRYVIVEDVMSDVPGFEGVNQKVFDEAKEMGFRFTKLEDIEL